MLDYHIHRAASATGVLGSKPYAFLKFSRNGMKVKVSMGVGIGLGITVSLLEDDEVSFIRNELLMAGLDCNVAYLRRCSMEPFHGRTQS